MLIKDNSICYMGDPWRGNLPTVYPRQLSRLSNTFTLGVVEYMSSNLTSNVSVEDNGFARHLERYCEYTVRKGDSDPRGFDGVPTCKGDTYLAMHIPR